MHAPVALGVFGEAAFRDVCLCLGEGFRAQGGGRVVDTAIAGVRAGGALYGGVAHFCGGEVEGVVEARKDGAWFSGM